MATAKKVTYRVLDKKNFVGFMHPKTKNLSQQTKIMNL